MDYLWVARGAQWDSYIFICGPRRAPRGTMVLPDANPRDPLLPPVCPLAAEALEPFFQKMVPCTIFPKNGWNGQNGTILTILTI